jgi:hypothetical protein
MTSSGNVDRPSDSTATGSVSPPETPTAEFTPAHRAGLDARQAAQGRTLDAVHRLEAELASAAAGREGAWLDSVRGALAVLERVTLEEQRDAALPESLLSDIARTQPRLRNRVRGLRVQYRQLCDTIATLRAELADTGIDVDFADVRQRLAWLLGALRHLRGRESDLIYEAYYEAFNRDVEDDVRRRP